MLLDRFDGVDIEQLIRLLMVARNRGQQVVINDGNDDQNEARDDDSDDEIMFGSDDEDEILEAFCGRGGGPAPCGRPVFG